MAPKFHSTPKATGTILRHAGKDLYQMLLYFSLFKTMFPKERSGYDIELSNGIEMKFDKAGNFKRYD